jgi:hypothetical protein
VSQAGRQQTATQASQNLLPSIVRELPRSRRRFWSRPFVLSCGEYAVIVLLPLRFVSRPTLRCGARSWPKRTDSHRQRSKWPRANRTVGRPHVRAERSRPAQNWK